MSSNLERKGIFSRLLHKTEAISVLGEIPSGQKTTVEYFYPENTEDPLQEAMLATKIGILADRGVLFMDLGQTTTEVATHQAANRPFSPDIQKYVITLDLNHDVLSFILEEARLKDPDNNEHKIIKNWFSLASSLYKTARETECYVLKTDGEDFPLNPEGINDAWNRAGLPEIELNQINPNKALLTMPYPQE